MKVVAFVPDLMDRSRFPSSANVTFVSTAEALVRDGGGADVVVADLNRAGAFEALCQTVGAGRRIGFTNHDNSEVLEAARNAGIEAMARSRFFRNIAHIVE